MAEGSPEGLSAGLGSGTSDKGGSREETAASDVAPVAGRVRSGPGPGASPVPLPRTAACSGPVLVRKSELLVLVHVGQHGHDFDRRRRRGQLQPEAFSLHPEGGVPLLPDGRNRHRRVVGGFAARQLRHHQALLRLRRRRLSAQHVFGHRLPLEHRRRRGLQALRRPVTVPESRGRRGLDERNGHPASHRSAISPGTTPTSARR